MVQNCPKYTKWSNAAQQCGSKWSRIVMFYWQSFSSDQFFRSSTHIRLQNKNQFSLQEVSQRDSIAQVVAAASRWRSILGGFWALFYAKCECLVFWVKFLTLYVILCRSTSKSVQNWELILLRAMDNDILSFYYTNKMRLFASSAMCSTLFTSGPCGQEGNFSWIASNWTQFA